MSGAVAGLLGRWKFRFGGAFVVNSSGAAITLASAVSATGAQTSKDVDDGVKFPASFWLSTTGRGATDNTVVDIEVSNDGTNWVFYLQLTMAGNGADGIAGGVAPWREVRANVTTFDNSGTGSATVVMV